MKPRKPMRRTELKRGKSELKRTELKRGTPLRNGPVKARRQTDTGPVKSVKDVVKARATVDDVQLCEVCGVVPGNNIHHRQPRGMGGSPEPYINEPSNLLWVCGHGNAFPGCHAVIENGRDYAKSVGWLVSRPALPVKAPVLWRGVRVLLNDQGGTTPAPCEDDESRGGVMADVKRHGTDWAYRKCASGPSGGACAECRAAHCVQVEQQRAKKRAVRVPAPVPPEIDVLRRQVACAGCGAVRVPCPARRGQAQTRICHEAGCPVALNLEEVA